VARRTDPVHRRIAGSLLGGAAWSAGGLQWVVDGYALALAALMLGAIVAAAFIVAARVVRESADRQDRGLDVAGIGLGGATLAVVTFALLQAGHGGLGAAVRT